jgi:hypothetical protein
MFTGLLTISSVFADPDNFYTNLDPTFQNVEIRIMIEVNFS